MSIYSLERQLEKAQKLLDAARANFNDARRALTESLGARQLALAGTHLTVREVEVQDLVRNGFTNLNIAAHLHITEGTVKFHVSQLLKKAHVISRTEL